MPSKILRTKLQPITMKAAKALAFGVYYRFRRFYLLLSNEEVRWTHFLQRTTIVKGGPA